jgi:hypothetical protein
MEAKVASYGNICTILSLDGNHLDVKKLSAMNFDVKKSYVKIGAR